MKRLTVTFLGSLLLGALVALPCGCGKGEPEPPKPAKGAGTPAPKVAPVKLTGDLAALQAEAEKGKAQLDATIATLDTLVSTPASDPRPQFESYKKAVAALEAQAATIRSRSEAMRSKGRDYFKQWEEQLASISTPEIRQAAETRRNELAGKYDAITQNMATARAEYDGLVSYLKDLEKIMDSELTVDGLKALAPKIAPAKEKAGKVKAAVDGVTGDLNGIAAIYSPGK